MPSGWRDNCSKFRRSGSTPQDVDTNIVIFEVIGHRLSPPAIVAALKQEGLLINAIGGNSFRAVTHLDISSAMTDEACEIFTRVLGSSPRTSLVARKIQTSALAVETRIIHTDQMHAH